MCIQEMSYLSGGRGGRILALNELVIGLGLTVVGTCAIRSGVVPLGVPLVLIGTALETDAAHRIYKGE